MDRPYSMMFCTICNKLNINHGEPASACPIMPPTTIYHCQPGRF
ncbi:hypothetical protein [Acetobacterium tundrae]|nr:hypothetical protein [Acetobacterium tundrae]